MLLALCLNHFVHSRLFFYLYHELFISLYPLYSPSWLNCTQSHFFLTLQFLPSFFFFLFLSNFSICFILLPSCLYNPLVFVTYWRSFISILINTRFSFHCFDLFLMFIFNSFLNFFFFILYLNFAFPLTLPFLLSFYFSLNSICAISSLSSPLFHLCYVFNINITCSFIFLFIFYVFSFRSLAALYFCVLFPLLFIPSSFPPTFLFYFVLWQSNVLYFSLHIHLQIRFVKFALYLFCLNFPNINIVSPILNLIVWFVNVPAPDSVRFLLIESSVVSSTLLLLILRNISIVIVSLDFSFFPCCFLFSYLFAFILSQIKFQSIQLLLCDNLTCCRNVKKTSSLLLHCFKYFVSYHFQRDSVFSFTLFTYTSFLTTRFRLLLCFSFIRRLYISC